MDDYNREVLAIEIDTSLPAERVVRVLEQTTSWRGQPKRIRVDNGPEFIAEAIRADSIAKTPHALLSRGVAGVRGQTLVVNLPGSTGGCRDGFAVLQPALEHALQLLAGEETAHRQT